MTNKDRTASAYQRNAFAPSLIAAIALFLAPLFISGEWFLMILFVVAILAVIVAWFAFQARHWWWIPVFAAIAVIWTPISPSPSEGRVWPPAQPIAAVVSLAAGATIRTSRS